MLFIPVFPPIDESTCAKSVLGILINFIPLLYMLATNPTRSPVIPPPNEIMESFLLKFFLKRNFNMLSAVFWFLLFSLAVTKNVILFLQLIFFF